MSSSRAKGLKGGEASPQLGPLDRTTTWHTEIEEKLVRASAHKWRNGQTLVEMFVSTFGLQKACHVGTILCVCCCWQPTDSIGLLCKEHALRVFMLSRRLRLRTTSIVLGYDAAYMVLSVSKENNTVIFKDLEVREESKGREHIFDWCGLLSQKNGVLINSWTLRNSIHLATSVKISQCFINRSSSPISFLNH